MVHENFIITGNKIHQVNTLSSFEIIKVNRSSVVLGREGEALWIPKTSVMSHNWHETLQDAADSTIALYETKISAIKAHYPYTKVV